MNFPNPPTFLGTEEVGDDEKTVVVAAKHPPRHARNYPRWLLSFGLVVFSALFSFHMTGAVAEMRKVKLGEQGTLEGATNVHPVEGIPVKGSGLQRDIKVEELKTPASGTDAALEAKAVDALLSGRSDDAIRYYSELHARDSNPAIETVLQEITKKKRNCQARNEDVCRVL